MSSFYIPTFKEMGKDEFVERYSQSYYLKGEKNPKGEQIVPSAKQTSEFVEKEIDHLLEVGIQKEIDVVHILAWKVGAIDQKKSTSSFEYTGQWKTKNADHWDGKGRDLTVQLPRFQHELALGEVALYVAQNIDELHDKSVSGIEGAQEVFNSLSEFKGLGATYMITLLYFISQGEWPIYDRFAKKAIDAIQCDYKPGTPVKYNPPSITKSVVKTKVADYRKQLVDVFGCYKNRDIDRALWVYGHFFPDPE